MEQPASTKEILDALRDLSLSGVSGLRPAQRRLLARVLVDEARKGTFDPTGSPAETALRFVNHAQRTFGGGSQYHVVRDHRSYLREKAQLLASERPPIAALILFATAVEHWANAMVVTATLRRGLTEIDAQFVIRYLGPIEKLKWLRDRFDLEAIDDATRQQIRTLIELRNGYVHYKWKGMTESDLNAHEREVARCVGQCAALLEYLEEYEHEQLSKDGSDAAIQIFKITRADIKRRRFQRAR